ncbi:ATP-binding protein [Terasakiella sp. A23]|uniref:hybrid sensor histidine kinase/response regulator n=1 Tax=Terasakiella sp. FCG-A23 TaxID=3080561 RepID=UPI0029535F8A|nr:ATP-binding protein [Terasakiella sp. A23]MDV7339573.1 ATP-binding protein [Terasakiella sp. A23]
MMEPKQTSRPFSLSTEIGGMFVLLGLLPLFLIGWQYYKGVEDQLHDEISRSLSALADNKVERVEAFARDTLKEVQVLANSSVVSRSMERLSMTPDDGLGALGQELRSYNDNIEASDLFLISPSGKIVFAAVRDEMVGIDLHEKQADFHLLASAFDRARTLLEPHNSDFANDSSSIAPSGFVAAPILKNGYVLGVAALRLNREALFRIIGDYSGLGRTGETMVAGLDQQNVQLFGPARFPENFDRSLTGEFKDPFLSALSGERDVKLLKDYRDKEVIAAWRYVPSFRWALVVKVDVEERLAPITQLRNMGIVFLSVMGFLVIAVSTLMARAITTPIRQLEVAARNLSERGEADMVPERGAWEINSLAKGFNVMSQRIQSYQTGLRRMVDERTAELSKAKDEAEKATRAKTEFLAMMSHEIRTPLNGLMGMAELLKSQEMGPLARDYVQTLHQSGAALSDLLNDLLDISRIEAGKLDLDVRSFGPDTLLQSLSALMRRSAEMKGLEYDLTIAADVPRSVEGDPARLRQILLNLTGNAIKFTAEGRINVSLDVDYQEDGVVQLVFKVKDSGIGIPLEEQHKLFQPFSQLGEGRSKRYGGAGLGLAISQRLAQRMDGEITLESREGEGACFSVSLPFKLSAEDEIEQDDVEHIEPLRILIVEDEPINRRVLSGLLRQDGHDVFSSESGEAALEVLKAEPVDMVLTDLRLPGISGFEVIDKVHNDWKIPVLAVTANLMPDDVKDCLAAGARDVIAKPIVPDALRRALSRSFEGRSVVQIVREDVVADDVFSSEYLDQLSEVLPAEEIVSLIEKAESSVREHLGNLMAANDADEIAEHAHKLAGVSGTYGMVKLRVFAKTVEKDRVVPGEELAGLVEVSIEAMKGWMDSRSLPTQG